MKYKTWDVAALPLFCATMMNLFEGNGQILNIYSEIDKPRNFFPITMYIFVLITIFLGISIGVVGYFAFGSTCKDTLLFNMPTNDNSGIAAQGLYIFTIIGSFLVIIQPNFRVIEGSKFY